MFSSPVFQSWGDQINSGGNLEGTWPAAGEQSMKPSEKKKTVCRGGAKQKRESGTKGSFAVHGWGARSLSKGNRWVK